MREALGVDGGGGDDDFEIRAPCLQRAQIAEEEVDVETAFVGLVDDDLQLGGVNGPVPAIDLLRAVAVIQIELHRREPRLAHALGGLGVVAAGAVHVEADAVAELASQQSVDGHPRRFARQVPEGYLDAGEGRDRMSRHTAAEDESAAHFLETHVHVTGILTQQQTFHAVDDLPPAGALVRQLAGAVEPFVGVNAHIPETRVARLDIGDFHADSNEFGGEKARLQDEPCAPRDPA